MNRIDKARARVTLGDVAPIRHDPQGRIIEAYISGSKAKIYRVIIRRNNDRIETECLMDTGAGDKNCNGGRQAACYHALAVLLQSALDLGLAASICDNQDNAITLNTIHKGTIWRVESKYAPGNPVWFVTYGQKPKKKTTYAAF